MYECETWAVLRTGRIKMGMTFKPAGKQARKAVERGSGGYAAA